eukprot:280929-Chlamydomonas_euryale.AAC.1
MTGCVEALGVCKGLMPHLTGTASVAYPCRALCTVHCAPKTGACRVRCWLLCHTLQPLPVACNKVCCLHVCCMPAGAGSACPLRHMPAGVGSACTMRRMPAGVGSACTMRRMPA